MTRRLAPLVPQLWPTAPQLADDGAGADCGI